MSSSPSGESAARWLDGKQRVMEERIASLVEVNSFTDNVDGGAEGGGACSASCSRSAGSGRA